MQAPSPVTSCLWCFWSRFQASGRSSASEPVILLPAKSWHRLPSHCSIWRPNTKKSCLHLLLATRSCQWLWLSRGISIEMWETEQRWHHSTFFFFPGSSLCFLSSGHKYEAIASIAYSIVGSIANCLSWFPPSPFSHWVLNIVVKNEKGNLLP